MSASAVEIDRSVIAAFLDAPASTAAPYGEPVAVRALVAQRVAALFGRGCPGCWGDGDRQGECREPLGEHSLQGQGFAGHRLVLSTIRLRRRPHVLIPIYASAHSARRSASIKTPRLRMPIWALSQSSQATMASGSSIETASSRLACAARWTPSGSQGGMMPV